VATVLERLYELGQKRPVRRASQVPAALVYARRCYDHLAGTLAVGLTEHLAATGAVVLVDLAPELTPAGASLFESIGVGSDPAGGRRPPVRRCLDWSERRPHLAGEAPAALLTYLLEQRWLRPKRINRAMELTGTGRAGLQEVFGYRAP
jgi:hypothetical protein